MQGRRATRRTSRRREHAAPKATKILLRETGTGDAAGPKALQKGVRRGCAEFAVLQKATELAETMVCLQGYSG